MLRSLIYNTAIRAYATAISLAAPFDHKARLWKTGRKVFPTPVAAYQEADIRIWVHCASLGEFEQGRPVIERLRNDFPDASLLLTFFSPSGYEVRKDYPMASQVEYLPLDTPSNARRFVRSFRPTMAMFVKYEFWYHFLKQLDREGIPFYFISTRLRSDYLFLKAWGSGLRKAVFKAAHIFTQDQQSCKLLISNGFSRCSVSGDTRFDRVSAIAGAAREIPRIRAFLNGRPCLVAGSTWPEDEKVLFEALRQLNYPFALIIAPHDVADHRIRSVMSQAPPGTQRYSMAEGRAEEGHVMVIDSIGLLSSLYGYADVAYVGGAFGKGLHNILEAAAHGKPVICGPRVQRFPEASALHKAGGGFIIHDQAELMKLLDEMAHDPEMQATAGSRSREFIQNQRGACKLIVTHIYREIQHRRIS